MKRTIHILFEVEGELRDIEGCLPDLQSLLSDALNPKNYGVTVIGNIEAGIET